MLFSLGGLHYFFDPLKKVARVFRLAGIEVAFIALFLLTSKFFSGGEDLRYGKDLRYIDSVAERASADFVIGFVLFSILAILGLVGNLFFNPSRSKTNLSENAVALGLILYTMIFFFFPIPSDLYNLFYNVAFAAIALFILYLGNERADIKLINIGTFWAAIFILAKYFDAFWELLPRSLFFMVGGAILILGGIALETKRRQLKSAFEKSVPRISSE